MGKTKKLMFMSLMLAYSLLLYIVESMLPGLYFIAPGAKLGLSNIVSLVLLYTGGFQMAITILITRVALSSIFGGGFSAFLYSLAGGLSALVAMQLLRSMHLPSVSEVGVSVIGSVMFNIGQLTVAAIMIENSSVFIYLPILMYVSLGTGFFVGLTAQLLLKKMPKVMKIKLD